MPPVPVKVPLLGSKSSARREDIYVGVDSDPPTISTAPSLSSVAVCLWRVLPMAPVVEKPPIGGSYNSATAFLEAPPAASTLPVFGPVVSKVAVW
jgi:hypothetical protein